MGTINATDVTASAVRPLAHKVSVTDNIMDTAANFATNWYIALPALGLLLYAIVSALVMRSRSVPHFVPKQQMDLIDHLREEIRGKPFDNLTTIQKAWSK